MARMIPSSGPREFDKRSQEGKIYEALSLLDDDFVVVHSMELTSVANGAYRENEADFVLFNKKYGVICIEAKAGQVSYRNGEWVYSSGLPMKHGGPFHQAKNIMFRLMDEIRDKGLGGLIGKCRFYYAVWFPSLSNDQIRQVNLPSEAKADLILTKDDLFDPLPKIQEIFKLNQDRNQELDDDEASTIIERILCPSFDIVPTARTRYDFNDVSFARLIESQIRILDFLQEQRFAVINGVAGSGKTLIAIEQAKRMSASGKQVLFLCFNLLLAQNIKGKLSSYSNIDVFTIDGFCALECGKENYNNYALLEEKLLENPAAFQYSHLVIDEGQDFGIAMYNRGKTDRNSLLEAFKLVLEERSNSTLYVFYDKYQLIQGSELPNFINEAECKLTLKVNCRNTQEIAKCSMGSISEEKACESMPGTPEGRHPTVFYSKNPMEQEGKIDRYIEDLKKLGLTDIVILTCDTEEGSVFASTGALRKGEDGTKWKRSNVPFTTCRKFKGLEADAVILVDVSMQTWAEEHSCENSCTRRPGLLFYTGASRAKQELRIVCNMSEDDFGETIAAMGIRARRRPFNEFKKKVNAVVG